LTTETSENVIDRLVISHKTRGTKRTWQGHRRQKMVS